MTIQQAFELALQHHQSGRLAEAEGIYRQILAAEPRHADALHSLGVIALQVGRSDIAVESIGKAIAIDPNQHVYHCNLGEAHRNARHPGEAIAAYHQALLLKPGYPEAYYNLGITLISLARTEEGISAYRRAIQFRPDYADAHFNLGAALASRGDMEDAVAAFQIGLRFMPQLAEGHHCLGNALAAMGRLDEAITAFRSALQLEPGLAKVHNDLGVLLAERGLSEQAITAYRHALQLQPDLPEIHNNLGNALRNQGRIEEAIAAHRRAIEIKPDYAEAHNNLGVDLQDKGLLDDADAAFRLAIRHKPDYAEAHSNLGNLLKDLARFDEALASYRRAVSLRPEDAGLHSNLIYASLFHPGVNAPTAREEGSRWERQHARHSAALPHRHGDRPNALRRLKVGYVSPDFRHHVISHFLTPLLETHDRTQFEIHCYSSVRRPDAFTDRLMKSADHWKDVRGIRDETLAKMIRADGIDILVDLTQHMADNRLPLFARKPAPVQVAWLGYPGSTGLSAIDYRFTDAFMEPEGSTWSEIRGDPGAPARFVVLL